MSKLKRFTIISLISLVVGFIILEITLRMVWGFGTMILYYEDPGFEYIEIPNQDVTRFGNRSIYNEYSMRSLPLNNSDSCIVLGFGDSVFNGGVLTDQDSLASTIVETTLRGQSGKGFRFLNVSAGSWAPDNCAAYLEKFGDFRAKMIVLFVSSHDAHDNMDHTKIVGVHQSYPDKQYTLATEEVLVRYIIPRIIPSNAPPADNLMINKNGVGFNPGFEAFAKYIQQTGTPFLICLHAEQEEVKQNAFNEQGQEILKFCADNQIKVVSGLEIGEQLTDFRDGIHINERGQRRWGNALQKEIAETLKSCL